MMSRSRRLFVLLLHLIGCQHYYLHPSLLTLNQSAGIVGVQPWPIVLEKVLDPSTLLSTSSRKHRNSRRHAFQENDVDEEEEAFWLQDEATGTCLGPTARLTSCGDATLWWVVRRKNNHVKKRRLNMGIWGADEEKTTTATTTSTSSKDALAFYVVDRNVPVGTATSDSSSRRNADNNSISWWEQFLLDIRDPLLGIRGLVHEEHETPAPMDCLVVQEDGVGVQTCTQKSLWPWAMNEQWGLHPVLDEEATASVITSSSSSSDSASVSSRQEAPSTAPLGNLCLVRDDSSSSVTKLAPCEDESSDQELVRLSLVRYRAVTLPEAAAHARTTSSSSSTRSRSSSQITTGAAANKASTSSTASTTVSTSTRQQQELQPSSRLESSSPAPFQQQLEQRQQQPTSAPTRLEATLPSTRDLAHKHAAAASSQQQQQERSSSSSTKSPFLLRALDDTNPILLTLLQERSSSSSTKSPFLLRALDDTNPILLTGKHNVNKDRFKQRSARALAHPEAGPGQDSSNSHRMHRRASIPVHPYIAASKNEVWTDPQTALTYPTDLTSYLGHQRMTHGRHTLMGVGQFRKGYVVKVYGVAYYVSKRDVLSDPFFKDYAHMTAEELRKEADFYRHLRVDSHNFERTIVIKTNMQLPAEVMRNSLQYDWKMLTEEAKGTLINSSMTPRPANAEMLKFIQSPENPGRCSCSQVAPEEYQADPNCCARGTELVFTWLKNGDLEIRLSGRLVDTFSRPDIAEGIFFEYLRLDDPMTPELIENVVKGFPFLLAPLDQVKGVQIGHTHPHSTSAKQDHRENPLVRAAAAAAEMADAFFADAASLAGAAQRAAADAAGHASNAARSMGDAARSMGDTARHLGQEANRRRELLMKHASSMPDMFMKILSREQDPITTVTEWVESNFTPTEDEWDFPEKRLSSGRVFGYPLSRWFDEVYYAPDEIGPMVVTPTMTLTRKMFLYLVHLYLLLLFIVSFPGSYTTRTRPIRKRVPLSRQSSDASHVKLAHPDKTIKAFSTPAVTVFVNPKAPRLDPMPDIARSSRDRLHCQERTYSRGSFLPPSTASRPSQDKNLCHESSAPRLKKKSLSYFL